MAKHPKWKKHLSVGWGEYLGRPECPYMRRWKLVAGLFSIRVHHFYRSDDERAFHDHPWPFVTLVLKGSYTDVSEACVSCGRGVRGDWCFDCPSGPTDLRDNNNRVPVLDELRTGSVRFRKAKHQHTVRVNGGVWTVIVTGPNVRTWGFWERRPDGTRKFRKANKWHFMKGGVPCE